MLQGTWEPTVHHLSNRHNIATLNQHLRYGLTGNRYKLLNSKMHYILITRTQEELVFHHSWNSKLLALGHDPHP